MTAGRRRFTGRREYFGALYFDRAGGSLYPFDALGAAVLEALATHGPVDVLAAFSAPDDPADPREGASSLRPPRSQLVAFLDQWREAGLLDASYRLDADLLPDRSRPGCLSGPVRVYLDLTGACNLRCLHCVTQSAQRRPGELDTTGWRRALERLAEAGVFELNVGGGEPLLRPDALALLAYACELGFSVALTTNGTLVDQARVDALGRLPLRYVAVSLDGASAATHEQVRGRGTFERTVGAVHRLAERTPLHVNLHFTIMQHNLHELEEMFALAARLPAHSLGALPIRPSGRALENRAFQLEPDQYREVAWRLERLATTSAKPVFHIPFMPGNSDGGSSRLFRGFGCGAAQVTCGVDPCGNVVPCNFFADPGPRESLLERGLPDIWHEGAFFKRLRTLQGNPKCLECRWFEDCRGGCRAQALHAYGDLEAPDCYCLGD